MTPRSSTPPPPAPRRPAPKRGPLRAESDSGEGMDVIRDLIVEVRDLRTGLERLGTEIEKLWARDRLHARNIVAAARTPRKSATSGGRKSATPLSAARSGGKAKPRAKAAPAKGAKPKRSKPARARTKR